jgi:RDD family
MTVTQPGYPGQRLGLPSSGPRSIAGMGRRLLALVVDWLIAYGLAGLFVAFGLISSQTFLYTATGSALILAIWFGLGAVAVRLFGFTPGQFALGLLVVRVDPRRPGDLEHVGILRAMARGALIIPVIPALFTDADGRGLQDLLTSTAVIRR